MLKDIHSFSNGVSAVVFAVKHAIYLDLNPDDDEKWISQQNVKNDCFGI